MTWNREEALRLIDHGSPWVKYEARPAHDAPSTSSLMRDLVDSLKSAVAEIDRRDRIEAGRERLTDTINKLTAERDKLIVDIEASCLGYGNLVRDRDQWRGDYETLAAHRDREISTLTAERDKLRADYTSWSEYADDLSNQIAAITAERDSLRQKLAEATTSLEFADRTAAAQLEHVRGLERRIAELEAEVARAEVTNASLIPDAIVAMTNVECTRLERDAALARVKELEAERSQQAEAYRARGQRVSELESLAQHLEAEREAAAGEVLVSFDDMPPGSTLGKVVIANRLLKHENQNLRERIAELEAADESSKFAIRSIAETHNRQTDEVYALQAILRAIYPVYRAAVELTASRLPVDPTWSDVDRERERRQRDERDLVASVSRAVDSARAALTPDLVAALKAAGVEVE